MNDAQVAVVAIGALVTITGGFFAQARAQNKTHQSIATGLDKLVTETRRGNNQSEKRNGHLGDLITQQTENNQALADSAVKTIVKAVQTVKEQHVEHQEVHESVLGKAKVEHAVLKKTIIKEKQ